MGGTGLPIAAMEREEGNEEKALNILASVP